MEEGKRGGTQTVDALTQVSLDAAEEITPVIGQHGMMLNDTEMKTYVEGQLPQLVRNYLKTKKDD